MFKAAATDMRYLERSKFSTSLINKKNVGLICRGGSRAAASSKVEIFVIIVNG